jgi:hypothetical protein
MGTAANLQTIRLGKLSRNFRNTEAPGGHPDSNSAQHPWAALLKVPNRDNCRRLFGVSTSVYVNHPTNRKEPPLGSGSSQ